MEEMKNRTTMYSGIMYNDPTGDIKRIRSIINTLCNLVDDMFSAWDDATKINDISVRHGVMERLTESIDNLMLLVQSVDRSLTVTLRQKEADNKVNLSSLYGKCVTDGEEI